MGEGEQGGGTHCSPPWDLPWLTPGQLEFACFMHWGGILYHYIFYGEKAGESETIRTSSPDISKPSKQVL